MSHAYYNEIDPYAAQWLRNLIAAGHIAPGDVDERSIVDVRPDDLRGYTQAHFFAGIGGWSLALRLAGWPDDRPVWTGSCPCQPFSAAGKGKAADDERHLWPRWFPLIAELRPAIVFGEQVEAAIGWGWLDAVFADLEAEGYACGAAVLPACGVGAPHIRARAWFVADAERGAAERWRYDLDGAARRAQDEAREREWIRPDARPSGLSLDLADTTIARRHEQPRRPAGANGRPAQEPGRLCDAGWLGNAEDGGRSRAAARRRDAGVSVAPCDGDLEHTNGARSPAWHRAAATNGHRRSAIAASRDAGELGDAGEPGLSPREHALLSGAVEFDEGRAIEQSGRSPWADLDWLPCTDGKARPVEPGTFPLAHGIPGRVGRLRAYGNAIVPQVAAEFIRAATD